MGHPAVVVIQAHLSRFSSSDAVEGESCVALLVGAVVFEVSIAWEERLLATVFGDDDSVRREERGMRFASEGEKRTGVFGFGFVGRIEVHNIEGDVAPDGLFERRGCATGLYGEALADAERAKICTDGSRSGGSVLREEN